MSINLGGSMTPDEAWELIGQGLLPSERAEARHDFRQMLADIWERGHVCGYSDAQDRARQIVAKPHNPYRQERP